MRLPQLRSAHLWFSSLAILLLQGCAVVTAPGFDFADPGIRTSVTLGQQRITDPANPPQGMIVPITPDVVRGLRAARVGAVPPEVQRLFGAPRPYTIGPSDIIAVLVYDHPELMPGAGSVVGGASDPTGISGAPGFIVGADGQITYPFIGRLRVEGLTEIEAAELLRQRLSRFVKDPQVTVRISSFRSRRAYVDGEVRSPGPAIFTDLPMTLPEAINRAGGITATGDRSAVLVTRGDRTTVINLVQLQELGINPNRILLENGDLVSVRSRDESKVFILGEIQRPSAMPMRNGRLTLNEALSEAGGPNLTTANTGQIYVIRDTGKDTPAVFHLNASSPTALVLAEAFPLQPRDIVYVDPVPLVQWNRVISLILPSAQALITGQRIVSP